MERLQKIIAQAGITSRRKAEEYITGGRVRVNGDIVTELGTKADPDKDRIEVDGKRIRVPRAWTYIILNKPTGIVTTADDELDRRTVLDLVRGVDTRLFSVGRLDMDAEGVLLLTNDGDLAAAVTHPAGEIRKTYAIKVAGAPSDEALDRLRNGVILEDGPAQATGVKRVVMGHQAPQNNAWIELTVTEGRNHLVKRMCDAIGHPVIRLRRTVFANLELTKDLRPGKWRHLRRDELKKLKGMARGAKARRKKFRQEG